MCEPAVFFKSCHLIGYKIFSFIESLAKITALEKN